MIHNQFQRYFAFISYKIKMKSSLFYTFLRQFSHIEKITVMIQIIFTKFSNIQGIFQEKIAKKKQ